MLPRHLHKTIIVVWTRAEPPEDIIVDAVEALRDWINQQHLDRQVFSLPPEPVDDVNLRDDPHWDDECAALFEDGP